MSSFCVTRKLAVTRELVCLVCRPYVYALHVYALFWHYVYALYVYANWHVHPTPYALRPTPYTLHPTPYTLRPTHLYVGLMCMP